MSGEPRISHFIALYSKVSFLKTFALSKIIYSAINLPIPDGFVKKLETIIYNFIWGKKDKIRRRSMICDHTKGGINMIDVESHFLALRASWMRRIVHQNKPWNEIAKYHFRRIGPEHLVLSMTFENTIDLTKLPTIPKFYQQMHLAFSKYKKMENICTRQQLFDQVIWGNRFLTYNKKCLYSKPLIDINILYISDILLEDGKIRQDIYTRLKDKRTYFKDITELYNSLIPFKAMRFSNIRLGHNIIIYPIIYIHKCSKNYYTALRNKKQLPPISENSWKREFPDFNFNTVFLNKMKKQHISKVK